MKNNINIKEKMQKVNLENIKSAIKAVLIDLYKNSKNWTLVTERPYYDVFTKAGIPKSKIPAISSALLGIAVVEHTGFNRVTTYKFNTTKFEKPDFDMLVEEVIKGLDEATLISSQKWGVIKRSANVTKLRSKVYTVGDIVYTMHQFNDDLMPKIVKAKVAAAMTNRRDDYNQIENGTILYELTTEEGYTLDSNDIFGDIDSLLNYVKNIFLTSNKNENKNKKGI